MDLSRSKTFYHFSLFTLAVLLFLVFVGSLVRSTGSGMGCPDWPKCYGYLIPPSEPEQLKFNPSGRYFKGQMIIRNDTLWVAQSDFVAKNNFSYANWKKYTRHDYAHFSAMETWIEYLNRLLGALTGLIFLALFAFSLKHKAKLPGLPLLCFIEIVLIGFQAWLGARVVDSRLAPLKITTHMVAAIAIVLLLVLIIHKINSYRGGNVWFIPKNLRYFQITLVVFTMVQILAGINVRQQVDDFMRASGFLQKSQWPDMLNGMLLTHKNLAATALILNVVFMRRLKKVSNSLFKAQRKVVLVLFLSLSAGISLVYFDFPALMQPFHLTLANILIAQQFYMLFQTKVK